jgi:hypothetical protein
MHFVSFSYNLQALAQLTLALLAIWQHIVCQKLEFFIGLKYLGLLNDGWFHKLLLGDQKANYSTVFLNSRVSD